MSSLELMLFNLIVIKLHNLQQEQMISYFIEKLIIELEKYMENIILNQQVMEMTLIGIVHNLCK